MARFGSSDVPGARRRTPGLDGRRRRRAGSVPAPWTTVELSPRWRPQGGNCVTTGIS